MKAEKIYPAPKLKATDWAYFAGILDGEGTIRIAKGISRKHENWNIRYAGRLSIVNTSTELLEWLQERFPATVCHLLPQNHLSKLPCWDWKVQGRRTVTMLQKCLPYLVCKRERAFLVLKLYSEGSWKYGGGKARTNPEEMARREILFHLCKGLKQKTGAVVVSAKP